MGAGGVKDKAYATSWSCDSQFCVSYLKEICGVYIYIYIYKCVVLSTDQPRAGSVTVPQFKS